MIGISALLGLAGPWPLAIVIDAVLGPNRVPSLLRPLAVSLGIHGLIAITVVAGLLLTVLSQGLGVVDSYVNTKLNLRLSYDFRSAVYAHTQRLSLEFHDRAPVGQLMFRINQQTNSIGQIVVAIPPLLQAVLTAVGMFVVALLINWQLALLAVAMVPLIVYSARYYALKVEPRLYEVRRLEMEAQSTMYEGLSMVRIIMSFAREKAEHSRWRRQALRANDARVRLTLRQTFFSVVVSVITALGAALVLYFGANAVLDHHLNVGELIVLLGYVAAIYQPIQQITSTFGFLQQQFVNFESALNVLDLVPAVQDAPDAIDVTAVAGRVTFDHVHFRYGDGRRSADSTQPGDVARPGSGSESRRRPSAADAMLEDPTIRLLLAKSREIGLKPESRLAPPRETLVDVSFNAEPGRHVAIVGPTGAGKTTIISLIMRFYAPTQGAVLLDGIDMRRLKTSSLRSNISIVLQEPVLFAGTIAENILYGKPDADPSEVVAAARAANIHDFVMELPEQYESSVGERGTQLSQGERQRISIARAFLKDAPILLLDEPTSSIDSKTELTILAALERLMRGRTTFTVAHRLSTVRRADLILVIDRGRLVELGGHDDLVTQDGLYSELHNAQLGIESFDELTEHEDTVDAGPTVPPAALLTVDLLIAALVILLESGSADPLQVLMEHQPAWARVSSWWLLIAALLAVLLDDSDVPLRRLAALRHDPRPEIHLMAQTATRLLADRHLLHSLSRRVGGRASVGPLDYEMVMCQPWKVVARISPQASAVLGDLLPKTEMVESDGGFLAAADGGDEVPGES